MKVYFPRETLSLEVYQKAYEEGELKVFDNRYVFEYDGMLFPAARVVWNIMHPNDLAQPDEEVHHKDYDRTNDHPDNLEKLTVPQHRALHCVNLFNPLPDGLRERVAELLLLGYLSRKKIAQILTEEFGYKIGKRRVHSISKKKSTRAILRKLAEQREEA